MAGIRNLNARPTTRGKRRTPGAQRSKSDILIEQIASAIPDEETVEDLFDSGLAASEGLTRETPRDRLEISHTRPGRAIMWKTDRQTGRVYRRTVPTRNMLANIRNGWSMTCPFCGDEECSDNPNECPGREKSVNIRCTVCGRRFFDPGPDLQIEELAGDEAELHDADLIETPEQRVRRMRNDHIIAYHPSRARALGLFGAVTTR
mgnify:FL=1